MKIRYVILGFLIYFPSSVLAVLQCPESDLIKENIEAFSNSAEGEITLDSQSWIFDSNLSTTNIKEIKSLHSAISDIDEHTCNYLIYSTDSNIEDASLTLRATSK